MDDGILYRKCYDSNMKREYYLLIVFICVLVCFVFTSCISTKKPDEPSKAADRYLVGVDIDNTSIYSFVWTFHNINFDAEFQRYKFYVEEGKYFFYHESRKRENEYGPTTEDDITKSGTIELSKEKWDEFLLTIAGGTVTKRNEEPTAGGSGPWIYLSWDKEQKVKDSDKYDEFSFVTYKNEKEFEDLCKKLAG